MYMYYFNKFIFGKPCLGSSNEEVILRIAVNNKFISTAIRRIFIYLKINQTKAFFNVVIRFQFSYCH